MGDKTAIEWADATWNPLVGCTRVSKGCEHCYAERVVHRGLSLRHRGLTRLVNGSPHWTGEVRLIESALGLPLRWKAPRRVFVNSLSDLFHEKVPDEWIDRIFGVMAQAERHVFQVLTKRPERMLAYLSDRTNAQYYVGGARLGVALPLPNVWLGVSCEDQATAEARIPLLLRTPAAVRWVSYEPALGPVDFSMRLKWNHAYIAPGPLPRGLDWLVVGGESGPGARPFDLAWARSAVAQCRAAGVACFVKQLGSVPVASVLYEASWPAHVRLGWSGDGVGSYRVKLRDRKGGDMAEWPEDLRVREYPS